MTIKISTWNLCLGLFHKKDYVRMLLNENDLDILALQETELSTNIQEANLSIGGYTIEIEQNDEKRRVAIYVKNTITYKRRQDLEGKNLHLVILDVEAKPSFRLIAIYRTFHPQDGVAPRENFRKQLELINTAIDPNTIIIGDMNLDERKRFRVDYTQRRLFEDFEEILGQHQLIQLVKEPTWERMIENRVKSSVLDHIYCTDESNVENLTIKETIFGDHKLVTMTVLSDSSKEILNLKRRNWKKYSKEQLIEQLRQVKWKCEIESVQEMWNLIEQELMTVTDRLIPYENFEHNIKRKVPNDLKPVMNRRSYLLKKRKRKILTNLETIEIKALTKSIRHFHYEQRKNQIRRKIIPGNNKSLWDAVKIAKDIEPTPLPKTLLENGKLFNRLEAPSAFATYFKSKIEKLEEHLVLDPGVWNGEEMITSNEKNFMTSENVMECLNQLKTKNCEGYDRMPLRILKDGAPVLIEPLSKLFHKIYETKEIPEQWKIAKVIPLFKKGDKQEIKNYRPISNLCSISKIYEKLIQKRLEEIAKENDVNLSGDEQHGFKKERSTITAALTLQSLMARELDEDGYAAMASLDLSAAFDLVNVKLLLKRMKILGIPKDLIELLEVWLRERFFYVEANGTNSTIIENDIGTIQGSILGPILYAIFIRPVYKIEKMTTFADDNYVVSLNKNKEAAIENLGGKLKKIIRWLKESGLKVNESKTEFCVFHRTLNTEGSLMVDELLIDAKTEINVLGITFDSRLQWGFQVSRAIKNANRSLQAIKLIRKFFTTNEIVQLLTSNFYSTLYYGSEIWQLPTLNYHCKRMLMSASASALKLCNPFPDPTISFIELHKLHKRALPSQFCVYRHCLLLYKVYNSYIPKKDWLDLNFKMIHTSRQVNFQISSKSNFKVGNNILINRLSCINKKIPLEMLNLSIDAFKIRCKSMFLL